MINRRHAIKAAAAIGVSPILSRAQSLSAPMNQLKAITLLTQDLVKMDGQDMEVRVAQLEYAPGGSSEPHRHPGHTFVYVLEGSLVAQLDDGPVKTYMPGQMFYEQPMHLHAVSKNASATEPVKFLVFRIAEKGKPGTVPK